MAAILCFRLWSHDVTQAFLQSKDKLQRPIYLRPVKELNLPPASILRLEKPLYGLADAGDYWSRTMAEHLEKDLGMTPSALDPALYNFTDEQGNIDGLTGVYVDDSILAGSASFIRYTEKSLKKFESRSRVIDNFTFSGIDIKTTELGFTISQINYIDKVSPIIKAATFDDFRTLRSKLAWIFHTRPDVACSVAKAAQVTKDTFNEKHIKEINKTIKFLKITKNRTLTYKRLNQKELHIKAFADSSFANNLDLTTQIGYIILLCDKKSCHALHYVSKKCPRVVRSVLGGEVCAFAEGFDFAFVISKELETSLKRKIPLQIFTDSKSLFDVITQCKTMAEKRLMIDIKGVRQAFDSEEITNVGLVASEHNPADAMTKITKCEALLKILDDQDPSVEVKQWVYASESTEATSKTDECARTAK